MRMYVMEEIIVETIQMNTQNSAGIGLVLHSTAPILGGNAKTINVLIVILFAMENHNVHRGRMRIHHFAVFGTVTLITGNVATVNVSRITRYVMVWITVETIQMKPLDFAGIGHAPQITGNAEMKSNASINHGLWIFDQTVLMAQTRIHCIMLGLIVQMNMTQKYQIVNTACVMIGHIAYWRMHGVMAGLMLWTATGMVELYMVAWMGQMKAITVKNMNVCQISGNV